MYVFPFDGIMAAMLALSVAISKLFAFEIVRDHELPFDEESNF